MPADLNDLLPLLLRLGEDPAAVALKALLYEESPFFPKESYDIPYAWTKDVPDGALWGAVLLLIGGAPDEWEVDQLHEDLHDCEVDGADAATIDALMAWANRRLAE
jgi:hypothetical protein